MDRIALGLVGIGKIARDQHIPALAAGTDFALAATASRHGRVEGVDGYSSVAEMLEARSDIAAVSLCTPPDGRFEQAMSALRASRHLMLEKPPAATVSEAEALAAAARSAGVSLFATWHSREAAEVDAARDWLADRRIHAVRIRWMEDIRQWHPGQDWILAAGGFGVFDPGINALSIATRILPEPLAVLGAELDVPANRVSPIAARIALRSGDASISSRPASRPGTSRSIPMPARFASATAAAGSSCRKARRSAGPTRNIPASTAASPISSAAANPISTCARFSWSPTPSWSPKNARPRPSTSRVRYLFQCRISSERVAAALSHRCREIGRPRARDFA